MYQEMVCNYPKPQFKNFILKESAPRLFGPINIPGGPGGHSFQPVGI